MSGRISNLLSHTFIYGLGNLLSKGIMFLMVPILTNTMVPDEFGKLNIVQPFIGFAEVFFMLGMRQAILRYAVKHEYTRSEVFTAGVNWISVATLISLTILILFSTFFNSFSKINNMEIYRNMMIILVLDAFANAPFAELQSEHRSGYYMGLRLTHVVFYFGISVYSILIKKRTDVNAILEANIVASACQILAGLPVYLRLYKFHIHKKLMGGMIKFGLPYVPNLVFVIAIDLVDRILISRWLNMAETGYYSAAYKFANLMYMLVTAFLTAWQPFFLSNLKSEGGPNLFARVMTYYTLTTALIFLFMGLFYNEIAALSFGGFTLIGPAFRSGLTVVPILLLAYAFCGAYYNMIVGIYAKEKTWVIPIVTLFGAVLNVGLNFYAIPNYGIKGAAVVTLISYAGMTLLLYPISMKLYFIKYEWNRILHVVFIAALLYIPSLFIKSFIYKSAAFILFLPLLYVTRFFLSEESGKVKNLLIKKGILK